MQHRDLTKHSTQVAPSVSKRSCLGQGRKHLKTGIWLSPILFHRIRADMERRFLISLAHALHEHCKQVNGESSETVIGCLLVGVYSVNASYHEGTQIHRLLLPDRLDLPISSQPLLVVLPCLAVLPLLFECKQGISALLLNPQIDISQCAAEVCRPISHWTPRKKLPICSDASGH